MLETLERSRGHKEPAAVRADDEVAFAGMNEEWGRWFPVDPPARQGAKLPIQPKGMKVSIAVIAEA